MHAPYLKFLLILAVVSLLFTIAKAQLTIYQPFGGNGYGLGFPVGTAAAAAATYTGAAAYDPTVLVPPNPPQPPQPANLPIRLISGAVNGLSKPQQGTFLGFSIELSVSDRILGKSGTVLQPTFLNLMANLRERSGQGAIVRVGGNSQERSTLFPNGIPGGGAVGKTAYGTYGITDTPTVIYSTNLLYAMSNITSLTGVQWYMGIPFNDTANPRLNIVQYAEQILGNSLLGLQLGNEPDLYATHNKRPAGYSITDYINEWQGIIDILDKDGNVPNKQILVGPSVCCDEAWKPDAVFDAGYLDRFNRVLTTVSVQHYPNHNCNVGTGKKNSQVIFSDFLNHTSATNLTSPYHNAANRATQLNKTFVMFETNTGSCGGFPGVSDSFAAALWGTDFALQMAAANFSHALMHVGGQNVYYNPFTPPPSNQTSFRQWTVGPIYYSSIVVAETLGSSGLAQIMDITGDQGNIFTPSYAIYESGVPVRLALFNFVTDPSGANDYKALVNVGGGNTGQPDSTPKQVWVRYLRAPSVASKGSFFWANQTFGEHFSSNGKFQGNHETFTIQCTDTCSIPVYAPSIALVFLTPPPSATSTDQTYTTSVFGKGINTATIDQAVLQTSNGRGGKNSYIMGSTSHGSSHGVGKREIIPAVALIGGVIAGAMYVIGGWR